MTSVKYVYLGLFLLGVVVPYAAFLPWLMIHGGMDLDLFIYELFGNLISTFFAADVIVSAIVLWAFVVIEGKRAGVRHKWAPILASITIGVSAGLPLFLFLRESAVQPGTRHYQAP
jgi:hypothetical protein